ncbi:MAG: GntR family transcriptional regulator [Firmicutes bacterium HGW-Firmicutes-7]|nr:MAG: GntR family transcriptional regulator [Firmicutes bacterium HGW-Firmicutes-7]
MANKYRIRPRDLAVEKIECYIIEHQMQPHQKLPSERDMCKMWEFNRSTLRSAIHRLLAEGVLYNKMGSGTFVAAPKLVRNLQDVKSFTQVVEEAGKNLYARVVSLKTIESTKQISKKLYLPLGHKIIELVRVRGVDEVPILIETSYIDAEKCQGIENYDFSVNSLYGILEEEFGLRLVRGYEKLSITYTDANEATLLGIEEGAPVIYQTGVVNDENNEPIEYFRSIARSEYIRFASVLIR